MCLLTISLNNKKLLLDFTFPLKQNCSVATPLSEQSNLICKWVTTLLSLHHVLLSNVNKMNLVSRPTLICLSTTCSRHTEFLLDFLFSLPLIYLMITSLSNWRDSKENKVRYHVIHKGKPHVSQQRRCLTMFTWNPYQPTHSIANHGRVRQTTTLV